MEILTYMVLVTCAFSCALGVSLLSLELGEAHDLEWELFKKEHSKTYPSEMEETFRKKIYLNNKLKILRHNHLYGKEHGFKLGVNKYADLLHHEFISVMNGFKRSYNHTRLLGASFIEPYNMDIPKSIDWTKLGAVTPVKDQGQCGSCWAFSSTGALEGQHFRKSQKLVSLSEQNLVDCSGKFGNEGCNGGLMDQAFSYVKENGGIDTEESYPYEAEDDKCRYNAANAGATDKGYVDVTSGSEKALMKALASIGPISVAIDASQESFQFYQEGVYYEPNCSSEELDHGVLAVGYGTDKKTGKDYWLVKNSWGTSWGEKGYIKMARNHKNNCGVATQASYPLV